MDCPLRLRSSRRVPARRHSGSSCLVVPLGKPDRRRATFGEPRGDVPRMQHLSTSLGRQAEVDALDLSQQIARRVRSIPERIVIPSADAAERSVDRRAGHPHQRRRFAVGQFLIRALLFANDVDRLPKGSDEHRAILPTALVTHHPMRLNTATASGATFSRPDHAGYPVRVDSTVKAIYVGFNAFQTTDI